MLDECCFDGETLKAYFQSRTSEDVPGSGRVIDLSDNFWKLGLFIDYVGSLRDWIAGKRRELDEYLFCKINEGRAKSKMDAYWLDRNYANPRFDPRRPATFVGCHLLRNLISDRGDLLKRGDGPDFCHAVMASAYSSFATLDKHWKRRVENLPKPNKLARIFYAPEIESMIAGIESQVATVHKMM